jgi:hypothetical protein
MILQYVCALQAPLLIVYTGYFRSKMPRLGIIFVLELLMVGFGPYLVKVYLDSRESTMNPQTAILTDGTSTTIFAMNMAQGTSDKVKGKRFDL